MLKFIVQLLSMKMERPNQPIILFDSLIWKTLKTNNKNGFQKDKEWSLILF